MSILGAAKKVAGLGGTLAAAYALVVSVEGRPIQQKDKPAKVKFAGLTVFERNEHGLQRVLFFRIRNARP